MIKIPISNTSSEDQTSLYDSSKWKYGVSIDTETTGTYTKCRVVQVAALRFRFRTFEEKDQIEFSERFRFISLIRPPHGTPFIPEAVKVTGIGYQQVRNAPMYHEIYDRLCEVIGDLDLVAHNAPFDRRMIDREHESVDLPIIDSNRWKCSLSLARKFTPGTSMKLAQIGERLGIEVTGKTHDAGVDAELAARIYAHITLDNLKKIKKGLEYKAKAFSR